MHQIDRQAFAPQPVKPRQPKPGSPLYMLAGKQQRPGKVACKKEKIPGQDGKVIAGEKARKGKAQHREQAGAVKRVRQLPNSPCAKAQPALVHRPEHRQQHKTHRKACSCPPAIQQPVHRDGEQRGAAQEGEHPAPHRLVRHRDQGHGSDQQPAAVEHKPPAQRVPPAPVPAQAADKDEGAADAPLPHPHRPPGGPQRIEALDHIYIK